MSFLLKTISAISLSSVLVSSALAYKDGTYICKNIDTLPNSTYKIETVNVGSGNLPYVEIVRYYEGTDKQPVRVDIKGFAMVSVTNASPQAQTETLVVGNLQLEFNGAELLRCKKP